MIYVNTDSISDSIVNGVNTNTLAVISTDNLTRSYPFTIEPKRVLYNPVFYLRDALGRPVDLNNIDWHLTLILRSTRN